MDGQNYIETIENKMLPDGHPVQRIKTYLLDNLSSDLSAVTIAQKFELSISSLLHLFKDHQKQTYQQYVEDIRMKKAFDLITKDGQRIQQAMYATGYNYKSTFNKAFKKKFNHPPRYFQK